VSRERVGEINTHREGHVDVVVQPRQDALLAVSGAELVPNDRVPVEAELDVGVRDVAALAVADDRDMVDDGRLLALELALENERSA